MTQWREVELGELCTRVTSGGTPKRDVEEYYARDGGGHRWVKSGEIADSYVRETPERITDRGLRESAAKLLPADSVLIAMYGATAGRVGLLKVDAAVNQAVCALVPDRESADPVFVFHALRARYTELAAGAAGAAQQNLNAGFLRAFRIPTPDLPTQRRIAAVLRAFDELIEVNERRIDLLEDLARSVYREWFLRFRFPGHEKASFSESELGRTPDGWTVRRLSEIVLQLSRGIAPKYADDGAWIVINQRCIRDERVSFASARRQERPVAGEKQLRFGDVLINSTGVGTLGRVAQYHASADLVTADSHVTIVRPQSPEFQAWLGLGLRARQQELAAMGTGSTGQTELSRQAVGAMKFAVPDIDTLAAFSKVTRPLLDAVPELAEHNDRLAATRDLLLPRLVSGRLDISDIDVGQLLSPEAQ